MMPEYFLYLTLVLAWALNIYFFCRFAARWHKSEPAPAKAWGALAAVCLPALAVAFFLAARGGSGSDQDLLCLGAKFLRSGLKRVFELREVAPLLTDQLTDALSGYSLRALLWKNRLLFSASAFLFFSGLRRLGAGLAVSFLASAFLFWNFLAPLNANTFSTTAPNLFIWLLALTALFDAHMSAEIGGRQLAWILASALLTACGRPEFLPVNLALLALSAAARPAAWKKCLSAPAARWLLPAAACVAAAWTPHFLGTAGAGSAPAPWVFPLKGLFYRAGAAQAPVAYPLQFMRHQLYFFLPFAYLFALAAAGLLAMTAGKPERWRRRAAGAAALLTAGYSWLNFSAALRLNAARSPGDLELEFLSGAQRAWVTGCSIYSSDEQPARAAVLKKYFAFTDLCGNCADACRPAPENCVLEYRPPSGTSPAPALAKMDAKAILGVKAACPGAGKPGPAPRAAAPEKPTTGYGESYDPWRDIGADIRSARAAAKASGRRVLVLVGGDWCSWCATMEGLFGKNPDLKAFLGANFIKVKAYYNPSEMPLPAALAGYPAMPGYPHIYVLNADGTVFESRDTTTLENGSGGYDREKFLAFLKKAAPPAK